MYEMGRLFLDLAMVLTMLWIVKKLLGIFYEKKEKNRPVLIIWCIYFMFQFYVQVSSNEHFFDNSAGQLSYDFIAWCSRL